MRRFFFLQPLKKQNFNFFLAYALVTWSFALVYNLKLNSNSKHTYYAKNDADFLLTFDAYQNQSFAALKRLQAWLESNGVEKPLFNRKRLYTDNGDPTVCVGIMTMRRVGSRFYTIQTVTSLLTRVKLKYQDRIVITLINVNKNKTLHEDLVLLDNLIELIHIDKPNKTHNYANALYFPKAKELHDYARVMEFYFKVMRLWLEKFIFYYRSLKTNKTQINVFL